MNMLNIDANAASWLIEPRPDDAFSASSEYSSSYGPENAKFDSGYGWSAKKADNSQWIEVDLGSTYSITKVSTKSPGYGEYLTKYRLKYSLNGNSWTTYGELTGNSDDSNAKEHTLSSGGIIAQYLRYEPITWKKWPSTRIEAYGSIQLPAWFVDTRPDNSFSASSEYNQYTPPEAAKFSEKGWSTKKDDSTAEWLQVDLGSLYQVTKVKTKGGGWHSDGYKEWTTKYRLKYSTNGNSWATYGDLIGNSDGDTAKEHTLSNGGITARYLRFQPLTWHDWPSMRVEAFVDLSSAPTRNPTPKPTPKPTNKPTNKPTPKPTNDPSPAPTAVPTPVPIAILTSDPTIDPTFDPTIDPTTDPIADATTDPTSDPTVDPTLIPTQRPTSSVQNGAVMEETLPNAAATDAKFAADESSPSGFTTLPFDFVLEVVVILVIVLLCCLCCFCIFYCCKRRKKQKAYKDTAAHMADDKEEGVSPRSTSPSSTDFVGSDIEMNGNAIYEMNHKNGHGNKKQNAPIIVESGRKVSPSVVGDFVLKTPGMVKKNVVLDENQMNGNILAPRIVSAQNVLSQKTPFGYQSDSDSNSETDVQNDRQQKLQTIQHPNFKNGFYPNANNKKDSLDAYLKTDGYIGAGNVAVE